MTALPAFVEFREEGPREGFQIAARLPPLAERAAFIDLLGETGLGTIQAGAFVSPRAVPNMADTAELIAALRPRAGVAHTVLWLNEKGFRLAQATPGAALEPRLLFYASDAFAQRNNNCTAAEMQARQRDWLRLYRAEGLALDSAYVMAAFGCNFEGEVPLEKVLAPIRFTQALCEEEGLPLPPLILADTMGWATPASTRRVIGAVRALAPQARLGLHLHDTRGLGLANLHAALELGVDLFDSSVGGLGGCPFAGHGAARAAGNVCTEDAVFLCHELGVETGLDLDRLIEAARLAERILQTPLMGRVMHSGGLDRYR